MGEKLSIKFNTFFDKEYAYYSNILLNKSKKLYINSYKNEYIYSFFVFITLN